MEPTQYGVWVPQHLNETVLSEVYLQNGSAYAVGASYSGLYNVESTW